MSVTESEMHAIRELFVEMGADLSKKVEESLAPQYRGIQKTVDALDKRMAAFEKSVNGRFDELTGRVDGLTAEVGAVKVQVGQVLDRLTVIEGDVSSMRAQLAGLARVDVQRRLDKVEARLAALEEARQ